MRPATRLREGGLAAYQQEMKWVALALGIASTIAIVQNWYPLNLFLSLPFCMIWAYHAWLHTERQLKYLNIMFTGFYLYGIARYFLVSQGQG
ncbi:peptidase [Thioclava sp. JE_KL1]|uniref:peptidase n=1 Tax=Thioclava sp. JE_KL1 TaxID=2651187 RepID=UPI00128C45D1|nr:peptidase [Thioclava sp. JE_KL1]MPQ92393.1 peptidase [Thioclava sp. JE_KL1]